jgi:hypothetical protein
VRYNSFNCEASVIKILPFQKFKENGIFFEKSIPQLLILYYGLYTPIEKEKFKESEDLLKNFSFARRKTGRHSRFAVVKKQERVREMGKSFPRKNLRSRSAQ